MLLTGGAERVTVASSANGGDADCRIEQYDDSVEEDLALLSFETSCYFWIESLTSLSRRFFLALRPLQVGKVHTRDPYYASLDFAESQAAEYNCYGGAHGIVD